MEAGKNKNKRKIGFRQVVLGSIFLSRDVLNWLPIVMLLAVLGIAMISNRFKGEKILREKVVVQEQVKEMRSEATTIEAELMNMSRYSEILREVNRRGLGLKQATVPPRKIIVSK
jgi:cell division protein FtsL